MKQKRLRCRIQLFFLRSWIKHLLHIPKLTVKEQHTYRFIVGDRGDVGFACAALGQVPGCV